MRNFKLGKNLYIENIEKFLIKKVIMNKIILK